MSMPPATTLVNIMDGRFAVSNGKYYSHHMGYSRYGKHLADCFDRVLIVGRAFPDDSVALPGNIVTGNRVEFIALPPYQGAVGFVRALPAIVGTVRKLAQLNAGFLLRVPGTVSTLAAVVLRLGGTPFSVECVADPADQLAKGSMRHTLRPLARSFFMAAQRWQCRVASSATYVTEHALQRRYPAGGGSFSWTDIVLTDDCYSSMAKVTRGTGPIRLVSVGMMTQLYKGQDTMLRAVANLKSRGNDVSVTLVGDGQYLPYLRDLSISLGLKDSVIFAGRLNAGSEVRRYLDEADIFVMPSRQEGLPRALLEAMARGLPCVASNVGGIPELLPDDAMVAPNDEEALALKIEEFIKNDDLRLKHARMNLEHARRYHHAVVGERRRAFYRSLAVGAA